LINSNLYGLLYHYQEIINRIFNNKKKEFNKKMGAYSLICNLTEIH